MTCFQAIYDHVFTWIVRKINKSMEMSQDIVKQGSNTVIGVLDIYGFEIFDKNRSVECWRHLKRNNNRLMLKN